MSLDLEQLDRDLVPPDRPLSVDLILGDLEAGDAEALEVVLRNVDVPAATLAKALKKQGFNVSAKSIAKWRGRNDVQ